MSVSEVVQAPGLSPGELWELLWRRRLLPQWLGDGSADPTRPGVGLCSPVKRGPGGAGR